MSMDESLKNVYVRVPAIRLKRAVITCKDEIGEYTVIQGSEEHWTDEQGNHTTRYNHPVVRYQTGDVRKDKAMSQALLEIITSLAKWLHMKLKRQEYFTLRLHWETDREEFLFDSSEIDDSSDTRTIRDVQNTIKAMTNCLAEYYMTFPQDPYGR